MVKNNTGFTQKMSTVIPPNEIEGLTANDRMVADQANETFKVKTKAGYALAEDGVTLGFAKKIIGQETAKLKEQASELYRNRYEGLLSENRRDAIGADRLNKIEKTVLDLQQLKIEVKQPGTDKTKQDVKDLEAKLDKQLKGIPKKKQVKERLIECADVKIAFDTSQAMGGKGLGAGSHLEKGQEENFNIARAETLLVRSVASYEIDKLVGTDCISPEKFSSTADGMTIGISVCSDGAAVREMANMPILQENDIMMSHNFQKGMYDLEVQDYLTGQVDRHMGNIYFDPATGKVKGIDNDLALPEIPRPDMLANNPHSPVVGMPMYMHTDTAEKIEKTDPAELRKTLESISSPNGARLNSDEIDGVINRLGELKEHIKVLESTGHILNEFNRETYDIAVNTKMDHLRNDNKVDADGKLAAKWMNTPHQSYMGAAYGERLATLQNAAHTNEVEFPRAPRIDDAERNQRVAEMGTTSQAARAVITAREEINTRQEAFTNAKEKLDVLIDAKERLQNSNDGAFVLGKQRDLAAFQQSLDAAKNEFATAQQNLVQAKANLTNSITNLPAPRIEQAQGWQRSSPRQSNENAPKRTVGQSLSRSNRQDSQKQQQQHSAPNRREPPKRTNRTAAKLEAPEKAENDLEQGLEKKEGAELGESKKEAAQLDSKSEEQDASERKIGDSVQVSPSQAGGTALRGPK